MAPNFAKTILMKLNSFIIGAVCLLSSCTYSVTSHSYRLTDSALGASARDFFYVEYGVKGSATATYDKWGGGHVRDGLIADAKSGLIAAHPLEPNQAFVNVTVDITETETGIQSRYGRDARQIDLTATVSADVIQFGVPGPGYELPNESARSLSDVGSISIPQKGTSTSALNEASAGDEVLRVGDLVSFVSSTGEKLQGEINNLIQTMNGTQVVVKYNIGKDQFVSTMSISSLTKVD